MCQNYQKIAYVLFDRLYDGRANKLKEKMYSMRTSLKLTYLNEFLLEIISFVICSIHVTQ